MFMELFNNNNIKLSFDTHFKSSLFPTNRKITTPPPPWNVDLLNLNFQLLKIMSRFRDTQLQVNENYVICQIKIPTYISFSRLKAYFSLATSHHGYPSASRNTACLL